MGHEVDEQVKRECSEDVQLHAGDGIGQAVQEIGGSLQVILTVGSPEHLNC